MSLPIPYGDEVAQVRFWSHVAIDDGCWDWTGARSGNGYGYIGSCSKRGRWGTTAAAFSWMILHGPVPRGMNVCHRCDNRLCVRPGHLFLGTVGDNARDMVAKGRSALAKLTPDDVAAIRTRYAAGATNRELAEAYGVVPGYMWAITSGKTWRGSRSDVGLTRSA